MRSPAHFALAGLLIASATSCAVVSYSLSAPRIGEFSLAVTGSITTTRVGGSQVTKTFAGPDPIWQTLAYTGETGAELGEWNVALVWRGAKRPVAGKSYDVVFINDAPSDTTRFGMLLTDIRQVSGTGIVKAWRVTSGTMTVDISTSGQLAGKLTFTAVEVTQPSSATITGSAIIDAQCATGFTITPGAC